MRAAAAPEPVPCSTPTSVCDPRAFPRIFVPASLDRETAFLQPGGVIEGCRAGVCDGL